MAWHTFTLGDWPIFMDYASLAEFRAAYLDYSYLEFYFYCSMSLLMCLCMATGWLGKGGDWLCLILPSSAKAFKMPLTL